MDRLVRQDTRFELVLRNIDIQTHGLKEPNPKWKIVTAEEWMRSEQGTRRLLAEQVEECRPKINEEDE